jgi:hypothetical protein
MESTETANLILGGVAIVILIGGFLMMFTTIFTTRRD